MKKIKYVHIFSLIVLLFAQFSFSMHNEKQQAIAQEYDTCMKLSYRPSDTVTTYEKQIICSTRFTIQMKCLQDPECNQEEMKRRLQEYTNKIAQCSNLDAGAYYTALCVRDFSQPFAALNLLKKRDY